MAYYCSASVAILFLLLGYATNDPHIPLQDLGNPRDPTTTSTPTARPTVGHRVVGRLVLITDDTRDCYGGSSPLVRSIRDHLTNETDSEHQIYLKVEPYCNATSPFQPVSLTLSVLQMKINGSVSNHCPSDYKIEPCLPLIGIIAVTNTENTIELARSFEFAQRSVYTTTASNTDELKERGVNVWSYLPTLEQQIEAMLSLAVKLGWDWMSVVCSNDLDGHTAIRLISKLARKRQICIHNTLIVSAVNASDVALSTAGTPTGVMYVGEEQVLELLVASNYVNFTWISNVLVANQNDYSIFTVAPELPGGNAHANVRTGAAVQTASYIAQHWIRQVDEKCESSLTPNCIQSLPDLEPPKERERASRFVIQRDPPQVIGTISNNNTVQCSDCFHSRFQSFCLTEECSSVCNSSVDQPDFLYIHGDYIMVIAIAIGEKYPAPGSGDPYSCSDDGPIAANTIHAEAAIFARSLLSDHLKMNLGILIINTCFNVARTTNLVSDIVRGGGSYCNAEGECLNANRIIGFLTYSSHISLQVQSILMPLNIIQISYGSTSPHFDNKTKYQNRYFARVLPSDTTMAQGMAAIARDLRVNNTGVGKLNSAFVLSSDTLYGRGGRQVVLENLANADICVENLVHGGDNLPHNPENSEENQRLMENLMDEILLNTYVNLIFVIADVVPIEYLLDSMIPENCERTDRSCFKGRLDRAEKWRKSGKIFIFDTAWGNRTDFLTKYGHLTRGSLSFNFIQDFQLGSKYQQMLENIDPQAASLNPWRARTISRYYGCKMRGVFQSTGEMCTQELIKDSNRHSLYEIREIYSELLAKAMFSLAYGAHDFALKEGCDDGFYTDCPQLYDRTKSLEMLEDFINQASIPKDGSTLNGSKRQTAKVFTESGDGRTGYSIYHHVSLSGATSYQATYEYSRGTLHLKAKTPNFYKENSNGYDDDDFLLTSCSLTCTWCHEETEHAAPTEKADMTYLKIFLPIIVSLILLLMILLLYIKRQRIGRCCRQNERKTKVNIYDNPNTHRLNGRYDIPKTAKLEGGHYISDPVIRERLKIWLTSSDPRNPTIPLADIARIDSATNRRFHSPQIELRRPPQFNDIDNDGLYSEVRDDRTTIRSGSSVSTQGGIVNEAYRESYMANPRTVSNTPVSPESSLRMPSAISSFPSDRSFII